MQDFDQHLNAGWWALRIGLGVGSIITGIDKYFNKPADWRMYLSPIATKVLPVSATIFMHIIGVVEIAAGLIVLSLSTLDSMCPYGRMSPTRSTILWN